MNAAFIGRRRGARGLGAVCKDADQDADANAVFVNHIFASIVLSFLITFSQACILFRKQSKGLEKGKKKEGGKKRKKRKLGENITFGSKKS